MIPPTVVCGTHVLKSGAHRRPLAASPPRRPLSGVPTTSLWPCRGSVVQQSNSRTYEPMLCDRCTTHRVVLLVRSIKKLTRGTALKSEVIGQKKNSEHSQPLVGLGKFSSRRVFLRRVFHLREYLTATTSVEHLLSRRSSWRCTLEPFPGLSGCTSSTFRLSALA